MIERDGYEFLPGVFTAAELADAADEWTRILAVHAGERAVLAGSAGPAYGARNLLRLWPASVALLRKEPLRSRLLALLGPDAGAVRGLYFDKPPGHSWALPWHKDVCIAVKAHGPPGTFTKPTVKAGVPHVEAPTELLDRMVTVRIHLDPMTPDNGPLRVVPGSHRGRDGEPVTLLCAAGDVLLMRPLLTHASGHSRPDTPLHRRIVHLECSPSPDLPDGYAFHDYIRLGGHWSPPPTADRILR